MHILITRPEPDASRWRELLQARGVTVSVEPLLHIELLPPQNIDLTGVQALIATSRNGLRGLRGSPALTHLIALPIFTVGPGTAELSRELGFGRVHQGPASARDLVGVIQTGADPQDGALLHLAGDKLAFDLARALAPRGFEVRRLAVYRSQPAKTLQDHTMLALASGAIDTVVSMSPLSAKTFVTLCEQTNLSLQCQRLVYICLSDNVAKALAPLKPLTVHVAPEPNSQAMFTLIEALAARPV